MKQDDWKLGGFSLATTLGVAYVLCAVFDTLFPPNGLLTLLATASPWPIAGSIAGSVIGFATFVGAGFVLGALHEFARGFWSKRLK